MEDEDIIIDMNNLTPEQTAFIKMIDAAKELGWDMIIVHHETGDKPSFIAVGLPDEIDQIADEMELSGRDFVVMNPPKVS